MRQLPLGVRWRDASVFETFVAGPNALAVNLLRAREPGAVWVWGPAGTGKTHLLQAVCARSGEQGGPAAYFPMAEANQFTSDALGGCEQLAVVCIDEVERIAEDAAWNRALFRLYNGLLEHGSRLILGARQPPKSLTWSLPDLASRMAAALIVQLHGLSDSEQAEVLTIRARQRGLELPQETAQYLLKRVPRDLRSLCALLETLDVASLASQRRLTIPFIRQVLAAAGVP